MTRYTGVYEVDEGCCFSFYVACISQFKKLDGYEIVKYHI